MFKNAKCGLSKRLLVCVICLCVAICTLAAYAEGDVSPDDTTEKIILYGKDAVTGSETRRSINVDAKKNTEYVALNIPKDSITENSKVTAEFEFYAKEEGVYNLTGIISKYVTVDNWVSPYSISVNDGQLTAADKLNGFSQTDGGYGNALMDVNLGTVYLKNGINKIEIIADKPSQYGKTILVHLGSLTFTKSADVSDNVSIDYKNYTLTHIDDCARPSDFNISPNADTGSILIQTSTMTNYKGYVLNYTFTAPKDGFYNLSGFINGYKSAYVSPFSISFDEREPEKIADLIAAKRAVADGTITSMAAANYKLGTVYLNGGIHTLKITVDTSINNGAGAGYKLQFGKTGQNFILEYITNQDGAEKLALEGNDCVYNTAELKNTAKETPQNIDGDVYLYNGTAADSGQAYTFDFYPIAKTSGYYNMTYTGTCNSNYYCQPTIKVGESKAADIAELKSLAADNGTQNYDIGSVWLDTGVNKVTVSFKGHTKATANTDNPAYNIRIGKMSFEKKTEDIFITAESPLYYIGTSKQVRGGGNSAVERSTYIYVDTTDSKNAPSYSLYVPKSGEYDFTVIANGLLKDITFDSAVTVGVISSTAGNDYVDEHKTDKIQLSKGLHTLTVNMKTAADSSAKFNLDYIKAAAIPESFKIKAVNAQRYEREPGGTVYPNSRSIVLNAVNTEQGEKSVTVIIAEYDKNTGVLCGMFAKDETLESGNNFINYDLTSELTQGIFENEVKVMMFENTQNIRPVMQRVDFASKGQA